MGKMAKNKNSKHGTKGRFEENRLGGMNKNPVVYKRGPFNILFLAIIILLTVTLMFQQWQRRETIRYDEFLTQLKDHKIEEVLVGDTDITGKFKENEGEKNAKSFVVDYKPEDRKSVV
jgi:hypothetical protein